MSATRKYEPVARYRNEINRAAHRLDLTETRIILSAIAKAGSVGLDEKTFYYVTAEDMIHVGASQNVVYSQLADAARTLFERRITIYDDKVNLRKETTFRWLTAVEYEAGSGRIGIMFSQMILPFLRDLTSEFTRLPLHEIRDMRSVYAIRLYSMLLQFKSTGHFCISLDDLRPRLEVQDKFSLYADLKKRVILPALKEINLSDSTTIRVDLIEKKIARRVHSLDFVIVAKTPLAEGSVTVLQQIPKLSARQISMYADKLSGVNRYVHFNMNDFSDKCTSLGFDLQGKSCAECSQLLRKALLQDRFVEGIMPFLLIVGYHPPKPRQPRQVTKPKLSISEAVEVRSVQLHATPKENQ